MRMRNAVRAGSLVVLVSALTGCCVMSPFASICAPGGFEGRGGGHRGGGHGGGHHHLLGEAPQPVSGVPVVAQVEVGALSAMYAPADVDANAAPVDR